ncbi:hypothetical protein [[Mycoplasma] anseris]|uniref:Single-stranded DNA-binding protein n=1 Tax=[Mycoplasma] anseris TaxID=92400 RepID=A0A2Z4ND90_9BACT|nr:hypothetical protein [[Mycoplasma] anseris]AWX69551.1 hypothetical protein DP065_02185 [[Mycoplasma] anseris]
MSRSFLKGWVLNLKTLENPELKKSLIWFTLKTGYKQNEEWISQFHKCFVRKPHLIKIIKDGLKISVLGIVRNFVDLKGSKPKKEAIIEIIDIFNFEEPKPQEEPLKEDSLEENSLQDQSLQEDSIT